MRRVLSIRAVAMVATLALLATARPAAAQIVRAFTPRFTTNAKGDITLIGNTLMTCPGAGTCTSGQNGTGANTNDNDFNMVYVDADADPTTFSSSSATLALPAGATILWAGLYWGGDSNNAARNTCKLQTPLTGYATVNAARLDVTGTRYQGIADITTQVRAAGAGTYRVANVYSTPNTADRYAGWSIVVVYGDATQPVRNLVVFDGYASVAVGASVSFNVSGFVTPPAGPVSTRLGVVAYEGDLGFTGDAFKLNGTALSDPLTPASNFFNSGITLLGSAFTAKTPNYVNQLGFDAHLLSLTGMLPNNATSANIQLTSTDDAYYPGMVAFSTDLYAPVFDATNFTKTVTDLNGAPVQPGDVLEYTVTMKNTGQDNATFCVLRDTLAAGLAYVPGSLQVVSGPNAGAKTDATGDDVMEYVAASRTVVARLGTGANGTTGGQIDLGTATSVRFRASVSTPAPNGTVLANQATLAFTAKQSGVAFTAPSDGDPATAGTQPTTVTVSAHVMTGTVFEDVDFGGGAGRSLATSGGVGIANATAELYDAAGNWRAATATDATGTYRFDGWPAGNYTVRLVDASVLSSRPGASAALVPVQTYRTSGATGAAVAVTDHVGGEDPARIDAALNAAHGTLASLTTAAAVPQSVTPVTLGAADVTGLDFGFNFDTIVSTRDAGQGSLRQFLLNANALGNAGLAQVGQAAGIEAALFMIPDGAAHPGVRSGLASALTAGSARVTLLSPLPALTDAATRIDGGTQTTLVGHGNAVTLGTGGSVGVDGVALPTLAGPDVELRDGANLALGLDLQGANEALAHLALSGFGNAAGSASDACVRVSGPGASLSQCVLGAAANAWSDPGAALRAGGDLVRASGAGGALQGCLLGFGAGSAVTLAAGADGWVISGCEFRQDAMGHASRGALSIETSGGTTVNASLFTDHEGPGVDLKTSSGGDVLTDCTIRRCGLGAAAATAGVRIGGSASRIDHCVLTQNYGAGVQVVSAASNNQLTRNAISLNGTITNNAGAAATGQLGIDLESASDDPNAGTAPYVTRNDDGDPDAGGNALLNFPVLESAVLANGNFTLTGWARPGATIEVFLSDGDPSGFGEGATWVASFAEGSAADQDGSNSGYSGLVNGLNQGSDHTNRFRFTIPAPGGLGVGARLTATATLSGIGTSECSGVLGVTTGVSVSGTAYRDLDHDGQMDAGETGTGSSLFAKLVPASGTSASQVVVIDPASGAYAFTFVSAGAYTVVLGLDNDPTHIVPAYPAGWLGTQSASGSIPVTVTAVDVPRLDFGLWNGSRADGTVFRDDGGVPGLGANDGLVSAGEAGVAFARVRLLSSGCAGGVCDSTLSDGAGHFTLWLPATGVGGSTRIAAVAPAGWLATGGTVGSTGGAYARATSAITFTSASGVAYGALALGFVPRGAWGLPGTKTVSAGGVATYAHQYIAGSAGSVRFGVVEAPNPALAGWSLQLVRDLDCSGTADAGEPVITPGALLALLAGQRVCVVARHASPAGAPAGAAETATLTASFVYTGANPALADSSALADFTQVTGTPGLAIVKSVDLASAKPGDYLVYTIRYTNPGAGALSSIVIRDATPPWTVFDSASCATLGAGLTSCSLTQAPAVGASGSVIWTLTGTLAPGGSGSVSYRVRVQ